MLVNESPPDTTPGAVVRPTVPSPMFPAKFDPQQYAAPDVVRPQVWEFAGATMVNDNPPET